MENITVTVAGTEDYLHFLNDQINVSYSNSVYELKQEASKMKTIFILLLFFCNSLQAQAAKLNIRMISRILVISAIALTLLAFEHQPSFSQVSQQWVARYNGPGNSSDEARSLAVDGSGNVYVTGGSRGSVTSDDYATVKYNSSGDQQWVARYNGPGNSSDEARSLAVDGSGNVYVTGKSSGSGTSSDYATVKYNSSGVQQWVGRYNGPANSHDYCYSLAVDGSGNVYVTGESSGSGGYSDYATIKYNSSGVQQWVARYNGPENLGDCAYSLAVDGSGNVYVTGGSSGSGTSDDYATVKYNSSGVQQWVARYNGPGNAEDIAPSLAVDGSGNVYVTGYSVGSGTSIDYATVKYNSSGVQQWVARYNGPANSHDYGYSLAVDGSGNVYVTGESQGSGTSDDYATVKYNSSGVQQWVARYNGPANSYDYGNSLAVDGSGNVYVTGGSRGSGTSDDIATVKYNSSGVQQWVARYNGPANSYDYGNSLALDGSGNVYVTGGSRGSGNLDDYATIKYSQQSQPIPQPSISISPIQINPGGSVSITGQNFRANAQVKVNVTSSNSELVHDQTYTTNSAGGFNASYSSNVNSSPGIYSVSAIDIATNQNAPNKIFEVLQPVENFNLSIISPSAEYSPHPELDSIDKTVDIEWIDKMITGSSYTIVGSKRKYKYGLIYSSDYGLNWSDTIISEGFKDVNSIPIFKNQLNLESFLNSRSGLNVMFRVIDIIKPNRFSTTAPKPVRLSRLTKANINLIWDYSYINERNGSPIGACADGVGRFYIKISKNPGTYNITGVSLYLSDDKSSTTKNILGKLTYARDTDHYSIEANGASSVSLNDNESKDDYWYWYVSPDDFWRNADDDTLMERIVKLNVTVYYSNGLPESETKSLKIIRTPLMLVHGFASDHTIWDNFISNKKINSIYKFYWTPDLDKKALFDDNAQILLNYYQSGTINKHSFKYLILEARHAGYATNQVSYVAHSMGGCVVRAAAKSSRFYNITNYNKGYVNRIITVDTPHKGSYLADFVVKLKTLLKVGFIKKKIRDNLSKDFIASSFILNGNDIEISGAVKNLQVNGTGKYYFQETNIPSFLIAGDFIPGQSDDLSNIVWGLSYGKDFDEILGVLDEYLPKTVLPLFNNVFYNNSDLQIAKDLLNNHYSIIAGRVIRTLDLIYKKIGDTTSLLPHSDFVVSLNSQLNGATPSSLNTFDKFNGVQSSLGIGHTFYNQCYEDNIIANSIIRHLNLPATNENDFISPIHGSQNNLSSLKNNLQNSSTFIMNSVHNLNISSPVNGKLCYVDSLLNVSFSLDNADSLKYVSVSFQGVKYYDTSKTVSYNFNILVNGNELDSSFLTVSATYISGDTIDISEDFKTLFVRTNYPVVDFKVNNDFYYLINNQSITPEYKSVFSNGIYKGVLNTISASVENPSIIMFNNSDKSFKAISSGETFAIVNNGGQSDTIYFNVNGEILSPGNTNLVFPANQAFVPNSDLKFSWNNVEYASQYNLQIADDINFENIVYRSNSISDTITTVTDIQDSVRYYWRVKAINSAGSGNWSSVRTFITYPLFNAHFYITVIPQGFYNEPTNSQRKKDTVKAYLLSVNSPYNIIDSASSVIDSISHLGLFNFVNATNGTYYLKVKHRNSIETWSKSGGEVFTKYSTMNFDFTSSQSQAFGNNLIQIGSNWCIYSGDVNQDEVIDASDMSEVDNDAYNSVSGYVRTDLTGDDFVDAADMSIVDNNAYNAISVIRP